MRHAPFVTLQATFSFRYLAFGSVHTPFGICLFPPATWHLSFVIRALAFGSLQFCGIAVTEAVGTAVWQPSRVAPAWSVSLVAGSG